MRQYIADAQQALSFVTQQASLIETAVYETQYPALQYAELIPLDFSAPEWIKSISFYGIDKVGQADWFHHHATDIRLADVERSRYEQGVELAGIGYRYTIEEISQAIFMRMNLEAARAAAAVRAYEEFTNRVALTGDTGKGWTGLLNRTDVDRADVAADGTGSATAWTTKTPAQIIRDINVQLADVLSDSLSTEYADTILLPIAQHTYLATTPFSANSELSILEWLRKYNAFTAETGRPITIRAVRDLATAGDTSSARMIVYRNSPDVLKMHIPMRHRFLTPMPRGALVFDVPGIFRLGGLEIRRPKAIRYADKI